MRRAERNASFSLRYGPWAVVLGASAGLGAAYARELAARGLSIVLVARRAEPLSALAAEIRAKFGVETRAVALDLGSPEVLAALERETRNLDVGLAVYNAARTDIGPFLDGSLSDHLRAIDVNCRGPVAVAHHFGGRMRERGRGGIVLMSSLTAFGGSPYLATYGASKAFNLIFAEGIGYELRRLGIDVTVCCAGATRTPGYEASAPPKGAFPPVMEPEAVVRSVLRALGRRTVLVPGGVNRALSALMRRLLPRAAAVEIMGGAVRGLEGT